MHKYILKNEDNFQILLCCSFYMYIPGSFLSWYEVTNKLPDES